MEASEITKLAIRAKEGDSEAFGFLYKEFLTPIYRYIYLRIQNKEKAEDLAQEVFLKVFRSLENLKIEKGFTVSYFYKVAKNLLIDTYRKKENVLVDYTTVEYKIETKNNLQEKIEENDYARMVMGALAEISEDEANVLILKFIKDYSNKEISEITGKSEVAIRQLQSRGIKEIKKAIKKHEYFW